MVAPDKPSPLFDLGQIVATPVSVRHRRCQDVVAQVVARLVAGIDYTKFKQAVHFDLGKDNTFVVWLSPNDLQVAKLLKS